MMKGFEFGFHLLPLLVLDALHNVAGALIGIYQHFWDVDGVAEFGKGVCYALMSAACRSEDIGDYYEGFVGGADLVDFGFANVEFLSFWLVVGFQSGP
jgi:hypothetical protein